MPEDRAYDVVLFGATGFTGALTAEYLAANAPPAARWALAGRDPARLEALRAGLADRYPGAADVGVVSADVGDSASLDALAADAKVVITTVGPYLRYGEPLVAVCAEHGTDYVDLTGEPEFVDRMYVQHHERASNSGARIVHSCGFDSVPHDLGVLFTVQQLPEGVSLKVEGFVQAGGVPSGGTLATAMLALSRPGRAAAARAERRRLEPAPKGRRVRAKRGRPRFERAVGAWAFPLATIDPQVIRRSASALDRYGPDFTYSHYAAVPSLPGGLRAMRDVAEAWRRGDLRPGRGPRAEQRQRGWFRVRFVGEGGGRRVVTEVAGGDPGYGDTSKMLAEASLCLAFDELPSTVGQVTPAVAMGDALVARLQRAGITFAVLEPGRR
jgi:short subunit dehydrogenase-like uncharacterized protein